MHEQHQSGTASESGPVPVGDLEHITLTQAAKLAPGRPSSNCVWRWCRQGVKAASGQRVRLKHMRFGSRIYTTRKWLNEFGLALAEADTVHFDRGEQVATNAMPEMSRRPSQRSRPTSRPTAAEAARLRHLEAERELREAGM